jgi:transcriptional regulator with XRE-family HTH domain
MAIREAAGISRKRLAKELGVAAVTVARWEAGSSRPSQQSLVAYVSLLEAVADEISGDRRPVVAGDRQAGDGI